MARVSTWSHVAGTAEEAFRFRQSAFQTVCGVPIDRCGNEWMLSYTAK